jgi:hypothetical protein
MAPEARCKINTTLQDESKKQFLRMFIKLGQLLKFGLVVKGRITSTGICDPDFTPDTV